MTLSRLHSFGRSIDESELPKLFTYPFYYEPHPLCLEAVEQIKDFVSHQDRWYYELQEGKMFGVLVVRTDSGEIGFLAAYSGLLDRKNDIPYFVPAVYDFLQPDSFFRKEEGTISILNMQIKSIFTSYRYMELLFTCPTMKDEKEEEMSELKEANKKEKEKRDIERQSNPSAERLAEMQKESQFQKAELKRLRIKWDEKIKACEDEFNVIDQEIDELTKERKQKSLDLQLYLFSHFEMLNARGEKKNLLELFAHTSQHIPPAGAGECAAPKLLQFAYINKMQPIAMAEFWWGNSPKDVIRHHGFFYPACQSKCAPILDHMLQGLQVEPNSLKSKSNLLDIIYEDDYLIVVDKPVGMMSIPGRSGDKSVYSIIRELYPDATGPLIVHRLDMSTSGLMLIAKTKEIHKILQFQFETHSIHKHYLAILEGNVPKDSGCIILPLSTNYDDRPRQIVNKIDGKEAITYYRVLSREGNETRIIFSPITGRTHQLRVHAACQEGLNAPIKGDALYGRTSDRLYLDAYEIVFTHPITQNKQKIRKTPAF